MKCVKDTMNHNVNKKSILVNFFSVALKPNVLEHKDIYNFLNVKFHNYFRNRNVVDFGFLRNQIENEHSNFNIDEIYYFMADYFHLRGFFLNKIKLYECSLLFKMYDKRISFYNKYKNYNVIYYIDKPYSEEFIINLINDKDLIKSKKLVFRYKFNSLDDVIDFSKKEYNCCEYVTDNYNEVLTANNHDINGIFYPKCTDIFMGYINECKTNNLGLINKKFNSDFVDLDKYTEISGVRTSIAVIANKLCDNPFFNICNDFDNSTFIVGYYAFGMHLLSLVNWINDISIKRKVTFMGRDGYIPKKAYDILFNKKCDYLEISRAAYIPVLFSNKDDLYFLKKYINIKCVSEYDIIQLLKPILIISDIKSFSKEVFKSEKVYNKFIDNIKEYYSFNCYKKYKSIFIKYINKHLNKKSIIFDVGYSGFPEYIINSIGKLNCDACFIHTNNSTCFNNSLYNRKFKTNVFYDFKPKYSGTLRELLISDLNPSCIGYKKNGYHIEKIYASNVLNKKNMQIIDDIQKNALLFVEDYFNIYGDILSLIDFNKVYMSLPFEFFMHKLENEEKFDIFGKNFEFDVNVNEKINLVNDWIEQIGSVNR